MRTSLLAHFKYNDLAENGEVEVVCIMCKDLFDPNTASWGDKQREEWVPPTEPADLVWWFDWKLGQPVNKLVLWCVDHLQRWHAGDILKEDRGSPPEQSSPPASQEQ